MGTTNAMGIPYPESTDLVANGASAMEDIATTVDAKSGLVKITRVEVGLTPVAGVNVPNAFSDKFDSYRVVVQGIQCQFGDFGFLFFLGTYGASNYYNNMTYYKLGVGQNFLPSNNTQSAYVGIQGENQDTTFSFDIHNPNRPIRTVWNGSGFGWLSAFTFAGLLANGTSYTSFQIACGFGAMAGGSVTVYGYRK